MAAEAQDQGPQVMKKRTKAKPKRSRRTKAEMEVLRAAVYDLCAEHQPLTVRNLYYLMVVASFIAKTERDYKLVAIRLAGEMRESGALPWGWIVDNTRLMRKPDSYAGLRGLLKQSAQLYRRDLWANLDEYVEVWCESDSIGGVLVDVTWEFDVPLMAAHGFSSKEFLYDSAAAIAAHDKPTTIYYVGDYDPSGVVIRDDVQRRLTRYLEKWHEFDGDFQFVPLAVTPEQIEEMDLPTKPPKTKKSTHAKATNWQEDQGTVEAEAIPPETMRSILREAIESHIPAGHLEALERIEEEEKSTLERLADEHSESLWA
jgi:hypothetical protein